MNRRRCMGRHWATRAGALLLAAATAALGPGCDGGGRGWPSAASVRLLLKTSAPTEVPGARLPLTVALPLTVPLPFSEALAEMANPLLKVKPPPPNVRVASCAPSPTVNTRPFPTLAEFSVRAPPWKLKVPLVLPVMPFTPIYARNARSQMPLNLLKLKPLKINSHG